MTNAKIAFLGTYHFNNPGLDEFNPEVDDVLSDKRQAEIKVVVDALAEYKPTHIAIEQPLSKSTWMKELYTEFCEANGVTERRAEIIQLGFRLAHLLNHDGVHCIDVAGEFPMDEVMGYAAQNGHTDFIEMISTIGQEFMQDFAKRQTVSTVGQLLHFFNTEEALSLNHSIYQHILRIGEAPDYVGAKLVSLWYERNLKIFTEITKLADADSRILVIIGQGHVPILRQAAKDSTYLDCVPIQDYLPLN